MHNKHDGTETVSARVNQVGRAVMDAAFAVHRGLGPGLLEPVYEVCLTEELRQTGFSVERQVGICDPALSRQSRDTGRAIIRR